MNCEKKYLAMQFDPQTTEFISIVDAVGQDIDNVREDLKELVRQLSGQHILVFTGP